ncbi:hypothetical protein WCLP8_2580006 [uncultured Gammaproteobacteria bacterium]
MSHRDHKFSLSDATGASLMLIASKLESMDQRSDKRFSALEAGQAKLEAGQAELRADVSDIKVMLAKMLDGQAVLLQNDMELKRRLDQRG